MSFMSIVPIKKSLEIFDKIQLKKSDPKRTRGKIRVKSHFSFMMIFFNFSWHQLRIWNSRKVCLAVIMKNRLSLLKRCLMEKSWIAVLLAYRLKLRIKSTMILARKSFTLTGTIFRVHISKSYEANNELYMKITTHWIYSSQHDF